MRFLLGCIIVLLGLGFLLQQLDVSWSDEILSLWWPILVIAVGGLAWRGNRRAWFGPFLIVLVGTALLLDQLNILRQSAWNYFWPAVIILFGGRILIGKSWEAPRTETGNADAAAFFGGVDRKVTARFERGDVSAWFGGVKLDLREADFSDQSTLNVSAGFGGVEVWVPKHVRVVSRLTPILGGSEDKSQADAGAPHTLTITGTAMFGGVTIRN